MRIVLIVFATFLSSSLKAQMPYSAQNGKLNENILTIKKGFIPNMPWRSDPKIWNHKLDNMPILVPYLKDSVIVVKPKGNFSPMPNPYKK